MSRGENFISGDGLSRGESAGVLSSKIRQLKHQAISGGIEYAVNLMTND
nr:MAG TPA: hypothetical protein [Caudoviricetes sp.]